MSRLKGKPGKPAKADLYIDGGQQYRKTITPAASDGVGHP
jgi:hypothetical protein